MLIMLKSLAVEWASFLVKPSLSKSCKAFGYSRGGLPGYNASVKHGKFLDWPLPCCLLSQWISFRTYAKKFLKLRVEVVKVSLDLTGKILILIKED